MSNSQKYDFFMDELSKFENQLVEYIEETKELQRFSSEVKSKSEQFKKENESLKQHIKTIENKLDAQLENGSIVINSSFSKFNDKKHLKNKISELITKIDSHISS